jgi:nitroimidazol reductase NimA-like FMN-containing flavoprotein (pyridoxamine 5'-phosphate oxidase superfamily)
VTGELDDREIEALLRAETIGRIGFAADGRTSVVPVFYAYDGGCVYGHSGLGHKLRAMRANPFVCFEVDQADDNANWRSVIAWGTFEDLAGESATAAIHLLNNRFGWRLGSRPPAVAGAEATTDFGGAAGILYRIRLTAKTGRYHATYAHFPVAEHMRSDLLATVAETANGRADLLIARHPTAVVGAGTAGGREPAARQPPTDPLGAIDTTLQHPALESYASATQVGLCSGTAPTVPGKASRIPG